jgi:hypothetical protein
VTPDVAAEPARSRWTSRGTLAQLAAVLGAVTVAVSLSLHWFDFVAADPGSTGSHFGPIDIPLKFLVDSQRLVFFEHPSILVVLIPAVVLGVLGALLLIRTLVFVAAGVALVVPGLFAYQIQQLIDSVDRRHVRGAPSVSLTDLLGVGAYVCAIAAVVMIVGGWWLRSSESLESAGRDRLADDQ